MCVVCFVWCVSGDVLCPTGSPVLVVMWFLSAGAGVWCVWCVCGVCERGRAVLHRLVTWLLSAAGVRACGVCVRACVVRCVACMLRVCCVCAPCPLVCV